MRHLLLLAIQIFGAPAAQSESGLMLGLQDSDYVMQVWVLNDSDVARKVNRRFLLGSLERGADFDLQVQGSDGKIFPITSIVESAPLRADDEILLRPNQMVGRIVDKCFLANAFSLAPGSYLVSAKYSPMIEWRPFEKKNYITATAEISIPSDCSDRK